MRPQETDIMQKEPLVPFDETDAQFLSEDKEFYEALTNLNAKETVFDGEHGVS